MTTAVDWDVKNQNKQTNKIVGYDIKWITRLTFYIAEKYFRVTVVLRFAD